MVEHCLSWELGREAESGELFLFLEEWFFWGMVFGMVFGSCLIGFCGRFLVVFFEFFLVPFVVPLVVLGNGFWDGFEKGVFWDGFCSFGMV